MSIYDHKVSLTNGNRQDVSGPATFIRLHASTGALKVDMEGKVSELVTGQAIRSDKVIQRFSIINESGASVDATFKIGHDAEITDSNLSGTVTASKATTIDTLADVLLAAGAATLVVAADSSRREALISNLIGNASNVRFGDASVGAARGAQCGAGQTATLAGTEAIYAFSATAQSVGLTVVRD